jgi:hypothetical protein
VSVATGLAGRGRRGGTPGWPTIRGVPAVERRGPKSTTSDHAPAAALRQGTCRACATAATWRRRRRSGCGDLPARHRPQPVTHEVIVLTAPGRCVGAPWGKAGVFVGRSTGALTVAARRVRGRVFGFWSRTRSTAAARRGPWARSDPSVGAGRPSAGTRRRSGPVGWARAPRAPARRADTGSSCPRSSAPSATAAASPSPRSLPECDPVTVSARATARSARPARCRPSGRDRSRATTVGPEAYQRLIAVVERHGR